MRMIKIKGSIKTKIMTLDFRWLRPLPLALLATAFDGAWALQALSVTRVDAVSNVELVSVIVWCFFHLPAALLCSAVLKPLGWLPADPMRCATRRGAPFSMAKAGKSASPKLSSGDRSR